MWKICEHSPHTADQYPFPTLGILSLTQWAVISRHLALRTSTLIRLLTDTANIIIIVVVFVRLGMLVYPVRLGGRVPLPCRYCVIADYGHLHRCSMA